MYFSIHRKNEQKFITGPFLLPVVKMLELNTLLNDKQQLGERDFEVLNLSEQEIGIYGTEILSPEDKLVLRDQFSTIEYRSIFSQYSSMGYKVSEWSDVLGITDSKHKNLLSGRTKLDKLQSRQLANMCMAHSYIQELSAMYLSSLNVNGVNIANSNQSDFGRLSLKCLHALKTSASIALRYYWSQRSHIDVCSLHPTIQKLQNSSTASNQSVDNWLKTAEWSGMTQNVLEKKTSVGRPLANEHIPDALEYLNLLRNGSALTPDQHVRLLDLAKKFAVLISENSKGLAFGEASLEDVILQMLNSNQHIESHQAEILAELVDHDLNNRDDEFGFDGQRYTIDI